MIMNLVKILVVSVQHAYATRSLNLPTPNDNIVVGHLLIRIVIAANVNRVVVATCQS